MVLKTYVIKSENIPPGMQRGNNCCFVCVLLLAQTRHWMIALHTTGRPAVQPLTQVITGDRETQTENCSNSLQVQHRDSQQLNHN